MSTETRPGKFQGEPKYARALYDAMLDGAEDEIIYDRDTPVSIFVVRWSDATQHRDLRGVYAVALWERSDGFVCTHPFATETEVDNFRASCEND